MPTKYPPAWPLNQAIRAAKAIYEVHSNETFNTDHLVEYLETTKTSSYFVRRIAALQGFGLLDKVSDDTVRLTDLAIQIVNPVAGEDAEARLKAFRRVDVLSDLLPRYPNAKLPVEAEVLKSVLLKSIGIERDTIKPWYDFVVDSFKAISGATGRAQEEVPQETVQERPKSEPEMKTSTVFLPSGKKFSFSVEAGYTPEDMAFVQNLLNLFLQATQKTEIESATRTKK